MKNKPPRPARIDRWSLRGTQPFAVHRRNPPGTKMLKATFKAKYGRKPKDLEELRKWGAR